jgi:acyl-CoA:acyl-CoA alkyltransferase
MTENSVLTHRNVGVLAVEAVDAPEVVTSAWIDEQLAETYERTGLKAGTLADLAGIEERRWWPESVTFDQPRRWPVRRRSTLPGSTRSVSAC